MTQVRILALCATLFLLSANAFSQAQKFDKILDDTLQSRTASGFLFINDSVRVLQFLQGDSTGFPASSVAFGKSRLIFRGDSGLYLQDGNSRVRLDSNFGAIFALKTTTITAGDGLSGGGDLSTNRTITANTKTGGGLTIITDSLAVDTLWNSKFASVTSNLGRFDTIGSKTKTVLVDTSTFQLRDSLVFSTLPGHGNTLWILPKTDTTVWGIQGGGTTRNAGAFLNLAGNRYTGISSTGSGGFQAFSMFNGVDSANIDIGALDSATNGHRHVLRHLYSSDRTIVGDTSADIWLSNGFTGAEAAGGSWIFKWKPLENRARFQTDFSADPGNPLELPDTLQWYELVSGNRISLIQDSADLKRLYTIINSTIEHAISDSGVKDYSVGANKLLYSDVNGWNRGLSDVAKGSLLYSQGTTTGPIWSGYPFLYSSTTNLGFGLTDTSINKNISTTTQSADTSAINFSFTGTGKPQMFMRGITGNALFAIDSQYVGVGIATPTYQFHVRNTTASDISGTLLDRTGLVASTANRYRILELGTTLSDNSPNAGAAFNGLECNPFYSGSGTLASLYGAFYSPRGTGASDTITTLTGTAVWLRNTSTGKVGTGVGYDVLAPTNAGTWTTSIGVRIANQGLSGMTTSTGLQIAAQTGASNSYALTTGGGNVGIGTATPDSTLHVSGSLHATSNVKFDATITGSATSRGSDAFTTTATTDTVTVSNGASTDYYFIQLTGTAAPVAADAVTVEALVGKFVLHRSASGTSGLTYNWFRIK